DLYSTLVSRIWTISSDTCPPLLCFAMDNNVLYQSLYDAYKSAFSDLKGNHIYAYFDLSLLSVVILGDKVQKMAVDFWKESKSQNANQEKLKETILTKISDLKKRRNK